MQKMEIIHFTLGGLELQEPNVFVSDWIVAVFCLFISLKIKGMNNTRNRYFLLFYVFLCISTFCGGLGHLFFHYLGVFGKFPSWITVSIGSFYFCKAMLENRLGQRIVWIDHLVWLKALVLFVLSVVFQKFIFIAVDSIVSYLFFGGVLGGILWRNMQIYMRFIVYGTLVLIPSAFIFILDINLHVFFNRDDFSHVLILISSLLFYRAVAERNVSFETNAIA